MVRLAGSGDEVHASAASWRRQSGTATVLEGFQADRDIFLGQLAKRPSVVHLATHVLFPQGQPAGFNREQSFVAFSLPFKSRFDAGGWQEGDEGPRYLTTARIATLHVPEALVVLTGCATGTGDARSGAGLLGLTRALADGGRSGSSLDDVAGRGFLR